jgi:hypothetical protein
MRMSAPPRALVRQLDKLAAMITGRKGKLAEIIAA